MNTSVAKVIEHYFSNPMCHLELDAEEALLTEGEENRRLFYVVSGELEGFVKAENSSSVAKVFSASEGAFIGVHSFFSGDFVASSSVVSKSPSVLAWIDNETPPVDEERLGSLTQQFTPVILNELSRRQKRAMQEAIEKEKVLTQLHTAEQMTTLGQLAAGIAHELNNAVGVLSSKTERMQEVILALLEELHPGASQFVDAGLLKGQTASSQEVRARAKQISSEFGIEKQLAKALARAVSPSELSDDWLKSPEDAVKYWSVGRDLHDMRVAARHSVSIVKSVKQLGRSDTEVEEWVDVNDTIHKSLALLQSDIRRVDVRFSPASTSKIKGSESDLVQVWANIIKNACDALSSTPNPGIEILTRESDNHIKVTIANNGPEIKESVRRQIFQPNFTTKKGGLSFGLGLGLSIVKRMVSRYQGSVVVKSDDEKTVFRIKLPKSTNPKEVGYGKN
ncbi:sensor histidine kinase [Vibrio nigripulchritudo]|uniref:sensor histidine kinase n=1 Tax=Vibrio nigripulchritudo TaxID=28173 RepID=UPI0003B1815E|nr:putative Signal transduction histidine kinase [Vibrio nigripulchritudo SFn118]